MQESADYHPAAPSVKAARLPMLPCRVCGVLDTPLLGPGTGPHVAKLLCRQGHFIKWAPRVLVDHLMGKEPRGMGSVNKVILVGTISKYGVTVKYATSGTPCASFALVLHEVDRDGKVHPIFQDCEVWERRAESISELDAGQLCLFEGKLAKRKRGETWDTVVSGLDLTPILAPQASLTGSTN